MPPLGGYFFMVEPRKESKGRHQCAHWCNQVSGGHLVSPWEIPFVSERSHETVDWNKFWKYEPAVRLVIFYWYGIQRGESNLSKCDADERRWRRLDGATQWFHRFPSALPNKTDHFDTKVSEWSVLIFTILRIYDTISKQTWICLSDTHRTKASPV